MLMIYILEGINTGHASEAQNVMKNSLRIYCKKKDKGAC